MLGPAVLLPLLAAVALAGCSPAASSTDGSGGASGLRVDAAPTSAAPTTTISRIDDAGPLAAVAIRDVAALAAPGGSVTAVFPAPTLGRPDGVPGQGIPIDNRAITELARLLPLGTPVTITA